MLRAEPGHVEYQTAPSGPVRTPWGRRQEWATWNTRAPDKDGLVGYASERQMWSGEFIYGATSTVAWGHHQPTVLIQLPRLHPEERHLVGFL